GRWPRQPSHPSTRASMTVEAAAARNVMKSIERGSAARALAADSVPPPAGRGRSSEEILELAGREGGWSLTWEAEAVAKATGKYGVLWVVQRHPAGQWDEESPEGVVTVKK